MTYDSELGAISRKPLTIFSMFLDFCPLTFGVAPCTASGSGDAKCYNTRSTCKDPDNYGGILNGDFTDWTGTDPDDWTVTETGTGSVEESGAGGQCRLIRGDGNAKISQSLLTTGKRYRIEFDIVSVTEDIKLDDSNGTIKTWTEVGHINYEFVCTTGPLLILWVDTASADVVIDNIKLIELKEYKFSEKGGALPFPGENIRPYIDTVSSLPTEIDVKKSITVNARITIDMIDEPDNDIGIDPYVTERSLYPDIPGTFFRKLLARNIYYSGRTGQIGKGFEGLPESDYVTQQYMLDQIKVGSGGKVSIICKDPLKRADRVDIPTATSGKVTDNPLTAGAGTINCDDTSEYTDTGLDYILIEDEIISYTGKTDTSFTGCTRGVDIGTVLTSGAEHAQDKKIQQCYVQIATNVTDIIVDILENHVGIPIDNIDVTGIDSEELQWLSASYWNFTGIITKPTKVSKILTELQEQSMSNIWWDDETQKVKFKVFAPTAPSDADASIDETGNVISVQVNQNEKTRLSRVVIYFNKEKVGGLKDEESYESAFISIDADKESADQYDEKATKTIFSRWIDSVSACNVIADRFRRRFGNPPKKLTIEVELKDDAIKTADIIDVSTPAVQNIDGTALSEQPYQVIKKQRRSKGRIRLDVLDTSWVVRYGFIAPAGQPDWDSASNSEKKYAYIGDAANNELGANNNPGFHIF